MNIKTEVTVALVIVTLMVWATVFMRQCAKRPLIVGPTERELVIIKDTLHKRDTTIVYVTDPSELRRMDDEVRRLTDEASWWSRTHNSLAFTHQELKTRYATLDSAYAEKLKDYTVVAAIRNQRGKLTLLMFDPPAGVRTAEYRTWRNTWDIRTGYNAPTIITRRFPLDMGFRVGLHYATPYDTVEWRGAKLVVGLAARRDMMTMFVGAGLTPSLRPEIIGSVTFGLEF